MTVTVPPSGQTPLNVLLCNAVLPFQASHVMLLKLEQFEKTLQPNVDKLLGKFIEDNDEQPQKAEDSISSKLSGRLTEVNDVHLSKAQELIEDRLL